MGWARLRGGVQDWHTDVMTGELERGGGVVWRVLGVYMLTSFCLVSVVCGVV